MRSRTRFLFLFLVACFLPLTVKAAALAPVERLECSGESLRGCMDKLTGATGVTIAIPSELAETPTYFRAERIGLTTCIDRAMVAAGVSNFALQVDESEKYATVVLLSDYRAGGAGKVVVNSPGQPNRPAPPAAPVAKGGPEKPVSGKTAATAAAAASPPTEGGNAASDDDMTMMQLNAAKEMAEIYRPNPNDIVDEISGKPVTYSELQQITKKMEQMRPKDDDIVDEIDGKKMTLKELTDVAKLAEKTYEQQVAKASAAGGSVD